MIQKLNDINLLVFHIEGGKKYFSNKKTNKQKSLWATNLSFTPPQIGLILLLSFSRKYFSCLVSWNALVAGDVTVEFQHGLLDLLKLLVHDLQNTRSLQLKKRFQILYGNFWNWDDLPKPPYIIHNSPLYAYNEKW